MSTKATDWVYTDTRPTSRPDLTYAVEVSTDLVHWSNTGVTYSLVTSDGSTDTWQATYPLASTPKLFFRLQVTDQ